MDFGIYLRGEQTFPEMLNLAIQAEILGFHSAYLNDHVLGLSKPEEEEYLEAWTVMTGIGVKTSKLRVGQSVLFNSLRNPAFLAKSVATLDQMTNGRFEFMIGAGWNEREYTGYDLMEAGRGMPSAGERVSRFEESLKIVNLMLNQENTTYDGKYWKLKEAINLPQPIQKPMRISVGCKGERMMKITANHASGINLSGRSTESNKELIEKFRNVVDQQGKDISNYYISGFTGLQIASSDDSALELQRDYAKRANLSIEDVKKSSYIGTPESLIAKLVQTKDYGFNMMILAITGDNKTNDPLSVFHDEIMSSI